MSAPRNPGPPGASQLELKTPLHTMAAFGVGNVPDSIKNWSWNAFVLFLYAQVHGLSGSLTGLAILIALIVDAVSDPYVGFLSDRAQGWKYGRRHTLMMFAVVPFGFCFYALFVPPEGLGQGGLFAWLLLFAVLNRLFITLFHVPYKAVGAELSRDIGVRPRIKAFGTVGMQGARIGLPLLAFGYFFLESATYSRGQLDPANYPPFAAAFATVAVIAMVINIAGTLKPVVGIERLEPPRPKPRIGPVEAFKAVISAMTVTPNVRRSLLLAIVVFFAISSISVLRVHLITYLWQTPADLTGWLASAQAIGAATGAIVLPFAVRTLDRKRCIAVGMCGYTGLTALAVLLPVFGVFPPAASRELAWALIGMFMAAGFLLGVYLVAIASLASDVADEHEVNTGMRQQALISGFGSFAIKTAGAVMALLTGIYLDIISFPAGAPVGSVPWDKVEALAYFSAGFCVLGCFLVLWVVSLFDVSLDKQREINRRLQDMLKAEGASTA